MINEIDTQATSILLPAATVYVFSKDPETAQVANALAADWRFARVRIVTVEGDVQTACDHLRESVSPELVILQADSIDETLTAGLEELARHCDEGTAAIVIGPVNDVYLYRKLIDMGVSDYLVRPVTTQVLSEVIARALIVRHGVAGSRLVVCLGARGGVGTTTIAQMIAWGGSDIAGQKTLLLDAAGGRSSLSVGIGFEPAATLHEAARAAENGDGDSLKRMIYTASDKLSVLAAGNERVLDEPLAPERFETLVDTLMVRYPLVVADMSGARAAQEKVLISRANEIVVVSTPTLSSLRTARSLLQDVSSIRGGVDGDLSLVINMKGLDKASEVPEKDIGEALEADVVMSVPFSATFRKFEGDTRSLLKDKDLQDVTRKLMKAVGISVESDGKSSGKGPDGGGMIDSFLARIKAGR